MNRLGIPIALLVFATVAVPESPEPHRHAMEPNRHAMADRLAGELLSQIDALQSACPDYVSWEFALSVVHCGKTPSIKPKKIVDTMARIDEFLAQSVTPSDPWTTEGMRHTRTYRFGDVPITIDLNTKSKVASVIYPMQPYDCDTDEKLPIFDGENITHQDRPALEYVTFPVVRETVEPVFPELARVARIQATVVLQATIRRDGTVSNTCLLLSTRPNMGFEEAARDAVSQSRYVPATINGEAVDTLFAVIVEFKLH